MNHTYVNSNQAVLLVKTILSSKPIDPTKPPLKQPQINLSVQNPYKILYIVVGSPAEANIVILYLSPQEAIPMQTTLQELSHLQLPTHIQIDNPTSKRFTNINLKQKRSKYMDMWWHWINFSVHQGQLIVYSLPGIISLDDLLNKDHTLSHMKLMRSTYIHSYT